MLRSKIQYVTRAERGRLAQRTGKAKAAKAAEGGNTRLKGAGRQVGLQATMVGSHPGWHIPRGQFGNAGRQFCCQRIEGRMLHVHCKIVLH